MTTAQAWQCPLQQRWTVQVAANGVQQQSQTRQGNEVGTWSIQGILLAATEDGTTDRTGDKIQNTQRVYQRGNLHCNCSAVVIYDRGMIQCNGQEGLLPEQVKLDHIQVGFEGESTISLYKLFQTVISQRKVLPDIQMAPPVFQFVSIAPYTLQEHH